MGETSERRPVLPGGARPPGDRALWLSTGHLLCPPTAAGAASGSTSNVPALCFRKHQRVDLRPGHRDTESIKKTGGCCKRRGRHRAQL